MIESIVSLIVAASYSLIPAFAESIWRGILVALALGITLQRVRISASQKHTLWFAALLYTTFLPILVSVQFRFEEPSAGNETVVVAHTPQTLFQIPAYVAATLFAIVLFIGLLRVLLLMRACRALSKLREESAPAPQWLEMILADCASISFLDRKIKVRLSRKITTPALAGFTKPCVLFPEHLIVHLQAEEIRQILLHEIAHLKRHDDWAILFQRLMSALYFFNPIIFWITKQMNLEREVACDDSVIESGGTPQSYALCLTRLAEFSRPLTASPMPSATSQLSRRVEMLLNRTKKNSARSIVFAVCSVIVISLFGLWISHASPLFAVTKESQSVMIAQSEPMNATVAEDETFATDEEFKAASERMKEAQEKMEIAREEMLKAAEAMRKSHHTMHPCTGVECEEMKELEKEHFKELDGNHKAMREHHRSTRHSERMMRELERELNKEEMFKIPREVPPLPETPAAANLPVLAPLPQDQLSTPDPLPNMSPVVAPAPLAPLPPGPEVPPLPKAVPNPEKLRNY